MRWDANSLSARMLHLLHQFVPDLCSVTLLLPTSSNTAYSLSGIGRFDKILLCPHEDGQEQRLSKNKSNPRSLRYISSSRQRLSTLLSCCSQHFFPVRVLASFIHVLPVVTLSDNDSKQIAMATSFRMSALLTLTTLLVKVKKISELVEKRKPCVCSTSLHFSKLITVIQFFSRPATGYECIAHALAFDRGLL